MRVHHRNLASLVGYCNDGGNFGIIYEYMAHGNLQQYLLGIFVVIMFMFIQEKNISNKI